MAKFVDGSGVERVICIRNQGELERLQEETGIALDLLFTRNSESIATEAMEFLYTKPREFSSVLAWLAGLQGEDAKQMRWSMDLAAFERGRVALLEAIADFCLQLPEHRKLIGIKVREFLTNLSRSDGLNKDIELAASSA